MRGQCCRCGLLTIAMHGSMSRVSRPKPPMGWRLGYVRESADINRLICRACLVNSLPSNIAA